MKKSVKIDLSWRAWSLIIGFFILIGFVGLSFAYNANGVGGNPAIMGHSADEIEGVAGGSLVCIQKNLTGGNFNGQILLCDVGTTITGGGCVWRSDGNDKFVYSIPRGNGWYCKNEDYDFVSEIWAICCKFVP